MTDITGMRSSTVSICGLMLMAFIAAATGQTYPSDVILLQPGVSCPAVNAGIDEQYFMQVGTRLVISSNQTLVPFSAPVVPLEEFVPQTMAPTVPKVCDANGRCGRLTCEA